MGRPSKIDKLPQDLRDAIARLRGENHTIDEIVAAAQEMAAELGVPLDLLPKRSGFGLHVQGLDKLAEKVQQSRAIAEALVRKLDDAPEDRQARLNIELLHGFVTQLLLAVADKAEDGQPVTLEPGEVHDLAKSLDHLARARRSDQDATLRLRREIAAEQNERVERAGAEVGAIAKEAGLSAERIAELQGKVAGLRVQPKAAA